ncbi:hypothetical protein JOF48_002013 [Arthrobacter stackebrandtii]|uniref:Uncharacterized protein n=1 Tax=Arthrobacter stackebrandtii TaxID=272161 RepID=A0ABS4YWP6_9MICC|nr:hypothetical protein [Arthrobacter stackebrandtii]MBP2413214.1 hypothetical protein [Arthrobacter stackebrandtii]PYH01036.1 hypothetical protein CVV67_05365 [Arthrobacter stackebrandtii]
MNPQPSCGAGTSWASADDGGSTWLPYTRPITVGKNAAVIEYRAIDAAGNVSAPAVPVVVAAAGNGKPAATPGRG